MSTIAIQSMKVGDGYHHHLYYKGHHLIKTKSKQWAEYWQAHPEALDQFLSTFPAILPETQGFRPPTATTNQQGELV